MERKIAFLPGEVSRAAEEAVVTTNCEKSAEAVVPSGENPNGKG